MRNKENEIYRVGRSVNPTRRNKMRISSGPVPLYSDYNLMEYINFSNGK